MYNDLGKLIEEQRLKLGLQQKQVAKMVGITNVSLCKVQTGERRLSKKKMKILADVLNVNYTTVLQCMGDDVENECKSAKNRLVEADKNIILLLDGIVENSEDVEILKEVISILNKSTKKEKSDLKKMLKLLKTGIYNS